MTDALNSMPHGITMWDKDDTLLFANTFAREIQGGAGMKFDVGEKYENYLQKQRKHKFMKFNSSEEEQEYFNNRVKLINGDSGVEIGKILKNIDESCCFWLDAHSGKESYARGAIDVPLIQELQHIKNHHIKNHIIAIDDAHLFGKKQYRKYIKLSSTANFINGLYLFIYFI